MRRGRPESGSGLPFRTAPCWPHGFATFRAVMLKVRVICVLVVLSAGLGWAGGVTAAQEAVSSEEIAVRDQLIADQEALLNVYRCRFGVDVQAVPGGCTGGAPARPAQPPGEFAGTPTAADIEHRDLLVAAQEELLNAYRCQHDIDTGLVPGGCDGTAEPEPTTPPTPQNFGPVPPNAAAWAKLSELFEFRAACNYKGDAGNMKCHYSNGYPNFVETIELARLRSELYGCDFLVGLGGHCLYAFKPDEETWARRVELAEYVEACGFGRSYYRSPHTYWECSRDPEDHGAPPRPEHNAEAVRLGREVFNCNYGIGHSWEAPCGRLLEWTDGLIMHSIEDQLFCQEGWLFETGRPHEWETLGDWVIEEDSIVWFGEWWYACLHPNHPTYPYPFSFDYRYCRFHGHEGLLFRMFYVEGVLHWGCFPPDHPTYGRDCQTFCVPARDDSH